MTAGDLPAGDELIARLQARAADPERRVDVRPSEFMAGVSSLDLGGLMGMLGSVSGDLQRVVAANQSGQPIDPAVLARADQFGAAMATPTASTLPPPADEATLIRVETALGGTLPPFLRRIYGEIADGGFGPGVGLLPIAAALAAYERMRTGEELPRGRVWPDGLLPVVERDPGFYCVDTTTDAGRVVDWDPEELEEFSGEQAFAQSFTEEAPSVEAWLGRWVGGRTQAEEHAELMQQAMADSKAASRAAYAQMTPEQKAQWGLTDDEWNELLGGENAEEQCGRPAERQPCGRSECRRLPGLDDVGRRVVHGRDRPEPAGLEVGVGLQELFPGVHHERAHPGDRLPDRAAAEEQDVEARRARLLDRLGVDRERVAVPEDRELAGLDRPPLRARPCRSRRGRRQARCSPPATGSRAGRPG